MAEAKVREEGFSHYYMDTDSIFVPPEIAVKVMDFFNVLNPYENVSSLLKIEDDKLKTRYGEKIIRKKGEDGFYHPDQYMLGISSKRYVCYMKNENGFPILMPWKGNYTD